MSGALKYVFTNPSLHIAGEDILLSFSGDSGKKNQDSILPVLQARTVTCQPQEILYLAPPVTKVIMKDGLLLEKLMNWGSG